MTPKFDFKPGSLVTLRNRPWVVLPSDEADVLLLKPLGGSDEEITGIFLPVAEKDEEPQPYHFIKPSASDIGDFTSAKLLFNAARLSFRNAAGPFRCLGKLSFRPRSYQMVPLIMALKQRTTRLLIADDVGVGKTIEALLIAKELYERKEIKRFAVVCLPHLCDQWQDELKSKFGIEAAIIRSGTATALERQIRTHENIFRAFPFQIISIEYIKTGAKRQVFIDHCPELIIVDEAHTCAKPAGANNAQQLRYHLIHDISKKENQHLVLLTATPHSGKDEEFRSLLGLLKKDFEKIDVVSSSEAERKEIAKYYIQRRRADVVKWLNEETHFPERNSIDRDYVMGAAYAELFNEILSYARETIAHQTGDLRKQRYNYWDALALLRGVMSSPAAGVSMLLKKAQKKQIIEEEDSPEQEIEQANEAEEQSVLDSDYATDDNLPLSVLGNAEPVRDAESRRLRAFAKRMEALYGIAYDHKAKEALQIIKNFLKEGYNPIVFCRYIQTANYLGDIFKDNLNDKEYKNLHIEIVTSELNDELRREKIAEMNKSERRLLIATDCLSEGINLQEGFNALLHYDLPWNPNRLEQREGRIDRFGQPSKIVQVALLYGSNNPIDGVVLEVLLRKAREIRRSIGISVPFPENSASVMEAVTNAILLRPNVSVRQVSRQLSLFEAEEIEAEKNRVAKAFEAAEQREKASRSIFAQNAIKADEIEADLCEVDEAIGDTKAVEQFVVDTLRFMGVQVNAKKEGYTVYTTNIPQRLKDLLTHKNEIVISFKSPTPVGYQYIGRNHPFTEHLAHYVINQALHGREQRAARAAVLRTKHVQQKTVLFQFRVRNVIAEKSGSKQIVAEEMWLWGYEGDLSQQQFINYETAKSLLMQAVPTQNMEKAEQAYWLEEEMQWVTDETTFRQVTDPVALQRAQHLVESHTRFRKLVNGSQYEVVEPVLPMDVLGIYILLPEVK
ncbi:MAG: DEAD/DEAH box helicase [Saprospiraceae bacterium]|nr:DEAD/DEAH box helicase [Saprospiraceae bacterium]MDW8483240.1 helicase-related protein [Saprospiraceae bacterium]